MWPRRQQHTKRHSTADSVPQAVKPHVCIPSKVCHYSATVQRTTRRTRTQCCRYVVVTKTQAGQTQAANMSAQYWLHHQTHLPAHAHFTKGINNQSTRPHTHAACSFTMQLAHCLCRTRFQQPSNNLLLFLEILPTNEAQHRYLCIHKAQSSTCHPCLCIPSLCSPRPSPPCLPPPNHAEHPAATTSLSFVTRGTTPHHPEMTLTESAGGCPCRGCCSAAWAVLQHHPHRGEGLRVLAQLPSCGAHQAQGWRCRRQGRQSCCCRCCPGQMMLLRLVP